MTLTNIENADAKPYWDGAREGRLMLQRCEECGQVQFPPRFQCKRCWSDKIGWFESSGRGIVESFSIVRRAATPEFRAKVPYVAATVIVEDGVRIVSNIIGPNALDVAIDDPVRVTFEKDPFGRTLPQFQKANAAGPVGSG